MSIPKWGRQTKTFAMFCLEGRDIAPGPHRGAYSTTGSQLIVISLPNISGSVIVHLVLGTFYLTSGRMRSYQRERRGKLIRKVILQNDIG